ncbi:MAG: hypothetical protein ACXWGX_02470, partial [Usitatibacter sp.]
MAGGELCERKALETQMNADVAQMNAKRHGNISAAVTGATNTLDRPICVHLRYICVHLRFQSLSLA